MGVDSGIPRDLSDSITSCISQHLGAGTNITLKKQVKVEWKTVEKKVLVLTDHRVVICSNKVPTKIECSIHFLELQGIKSSDIKLEFKYEGKKLVMFADSSPSEINEIVFQISDSLIQVFPHMTLQKLTGPLDISPPDRMKEVTDKLKSKTLLREASPCANFSTQYRCMCDLHNQPFLDEVAWDVDTIYLSQNCKWLILSDFDHLDAKHFVPIISALRHNTWFTTLCSCNVRLGPDAMTEFAGVLKTNTTIEHVCALNSNGRSDFVQKISSAIMSNISDTAVNFFDFKGNPIEDKGALYLCPVVSDLSKGLVHLELSKCRLTHVAANRLAGALCSNPIHMSTLTYLNLSGNSLKDDITNFHNFLAQPNALTQLNLSGTECALDNIFGALYRGCSLKLEHLNLSNNVFTNKRVKPADVMVPVSWKQYFASALALSSVSVANTKLPLEAVKNLLLGINSNEHLHEVKVDLRATDLREEGALMLETCLGENKNITELDISDNGFEQHTIKIVRALAANHHLKTLAIGRNFSSLKPKYIPEVIEAIVDLISAENSTIESLSVADSKLKADTVILINALGGNASLTALDVSGNGMGDYGARMLSKALHINNKLHVLHWDNNGISPQGYTDVAWAMTRNFCLRKMPTPLNDLTQAQSKDSKKTHKAWHQIEEALMRNNSPRRYGSEQAYRLQQGFLLSTSQQAIDKYIVRLLDIIEDLERGETSIAVLNEIGLARGLMKDAENCRQLLIQLQTIGQKCEASGNQVESKLKVMAGDLQECLEAQLKGTLSSMMTCVQGKSLSVMENRQFEQKVEQGSAERVSVPRNFCSTVLLEQVATEIYNKSSEVNVSVASYISEELIEGLLEALDKCSKTLSSHQGSGLDQLARASILRGKQGSTSTASTTQQTQQPSTNYRKSVIAGKCRPVSTLSPSDAPGLQSSLLGSLDQPVFPDCSDTGSEEESSAKPIHRPVTQVPKPLTVDVKTAEKSPEPVSSQVSAPPQQLSASPRTSLSVPTTKAPQPTSPSNSPLPSPRLDKPLPPAKPPNKPQAGVARRSVEKTTSKYVFKGDQFTPSPEREGEGAGGAESGEPKPRPAPRRKHARQGSGTPLRDSEVRGSVMSTMSVSMETETLVTKGDVKSAESDESNGKAKDNVIVEEVNAKDSKAKDKDMDKVEEFKDKEKVKVQENMGKDRVKAEEFKDREKVKDLDKDPLKVKDEEKKEGIKEEKASVEQVQTVGESEKSEASKPSSGLTVEESSDEETDERTDTTDTNSVDSLLEESITKPEKKSEEPKQKQKDASPKTKQSSVKTKTKGGQSQGKAGKSVAEFDFLAPSTEAPKLFHVNKSRPQAKRNIVKKPTQRKDTQVTEDGDVTEGLNDFYKQNQVVKEHVVPTNSSAKPSPSPASPKQKEEAGSKTSTPEDRPPPKPTKKALIPKFGFGKMSNPFKTSKSQENVTAPPKGTPASSAPPPGGSTEGSPVDSAHSKTPESPVKSHSSQKAAAPKAPGDRESLPAAQEVEEPSKNEEAEPEKPKEEPPKPPKWVPPGAKGYPGMSGMNLMAEIKKKRETMGPSKPPAPSKTETSSADSSSRPEVRDRKLKPVTEAPPKASTMREPTQPKPAAPSRPPSLYPRLPPDIPGVDKSPNRSLSQSNAEEKKKDEPAAEVKADMKAEVKAPAPDRQAPQPPTRPSKPNRPDIPPGRSMTVPSTKPPAPPVPNAASAATATRGFADEGDAPAVSGQEKQVDTPRSNAAVKRRSSIKDRIALLDKNSNESSRVAEQPAVVPPPPPPAHTKPKAFAYLSKDNADTSGVNDSGTDAKRQSGGPELKSKSLHGSPSGPTASPSPATNSSNGDLPGNNNNNTLTTTPTKNSRPAVPARPLSKLLEVSKRAESPKSGEGASSSSEESDKRASSASSGSTQEQEVKPESKHNSKEMEVFL